MKKSPIGLLSVLLDIIKIIDTRSYDNDELKIQLKYINDIYKSMNQKNKNELWNLISDNVMGDAQLHIFLLSIILEATEDDLALHQMVPILTDKKVSINQSLYALFRISRFDFTNTGNINRYVLRRILHKSIKDRLGESLKLPYQYRKMEDRNQNRIVIFTGTLLNLNHAPSRMVMEHCIKLQKILKKEVLLVVCPIEYSDECQFTWFQPFEISFNKNFEKKIVKLSYKNEVINQYQLTLNTDNMQHFQNLIDTIYNYNPLYILSMGSYFAWEDMMSQFTSVIALGMTLHFPISDAPILYYNNSVPEELLRPELDYMLKNNQIPLEYKLGVDFDEARNMLQRKNFQINENAFVIAVVGNRLSIEITDEFYEFLYSVLDLDNRIVIAFIGEYDKKILSEEKKNRIFFLGYQMDLAGAYNVADLYLNPIRKGGGMSALIALFNGVPVVTLPNCDVACNVGENFICNNFNEMLALIQLYLSDNKFYKEQQKKGLEITHNNSEEATYNEMLFDIQNAIHQIEQSKI